MEFAEIHLGTVTMIRVAKVRQGGADAGWGAATRILAIPTSFRDSDVTAPAGQYNAASGRADPAGELHRRVETKQMRTVIWFVLLSIEFVSVAPRPADARTWTDRTGRQLDAEFVGFADGEVQIKRTSDGKTFHLPLERFSDVDQAFVKSQTQADPSPPKPAPSAPNALAGQAVKGAQQPASPVPNPPDQANPKPDGDTGKNSDGAKEPAKVKPESSKPAKSTKRSPGAAGKIEGQLFRAFKLWDHNKDDAVEKEELEKAYAPKVGANKPPVAADPKAAVAALYDKLDADKDGKVDQKEFGAWATPFAAHLVNFAELQERRAGIERELVNMQRLLSRSGNVTAADGIFASEANRGIISYQEMLKNIDTELNKLATDGGHAEYRDLLVQKLFR